MQLLNVPFVASYSAIWMIIMQFAIVVLLIIIIGHVVEWKKYIPYLNKETPESIEQKLAGFDESVFAEIVVDEKGIVTNVNKQAEELFQYSEAEFKGSDLHKIIPSEYQKMHSEGLAREAGKDTPDKKYLLPAIKKDSTRFMIELFLRKRKIGNKCYYLGVALDVTKQEEEKKVREDEIKLLKFKLSIVDKGEEISNMASWIWNIKTGEITASDGYKKITHLSFGNYYQFDKITPKIWDGDRETLNSALYNATIEGLDYDITYRQIRIDDLQVVHLRSIGKVEKNEDGIPVFLHGSTKLERVTSIKDAENY